eukprot:TRINITY_DN28842_c0_g1_i1.p1 TRINITY_DN28842_c0_g1~~TRINITY_DN28842_c0_g1_i1.p1  ORF type:complete len:869 (-),score=123.93 TRINITY_DN28842_c0_g1_i1:82-2688(-)
MHSESEFRNFLSSEFQSLQARILQVAFSSSQPAQRPPESPQAEDLLRCPPPSPRTPHSPFFPRHEPWSPAPKMHLPSQIDDGSSSPSELGITPTPTKEIEVSKDAPSEQYDSVLPFDASSVNGGAANGETASKRSFRSFFKEAAAKDQALSAEGGSNRNLHRDGASPEAKHGKTHVSFAGLGEEQCSAPAIPAMVHDVDSDQNLERSMSSPIRTDLISAVETTSPARSLSDVANLKLLARKLSLIRANDSSSELDRKGSHMSLVSGGAAASEADVVDLHEQALFKAHEAWSIDPEVMMDKFTLFRSGTLVTQIDDDPAAPAFNRSKTTESIVSTFFTSHSFNWHSGFMSDPNAKWRVVWNFLTLLATSYDMISVPLQIFDLPDNKFFQVMQIITLVFWACDVPLNFCVGFHRLGYVEMRPRKVALKYLKSWFVFDVALVLLDVILLAVSGVGEEAEAAGLGRLAKTGRALRIIRSIRLARTLRLPRQLADIEEMVTSEVSKSVLGILKLVIFIFILNHFIACFWYGIGSSETASWVTAFEMRSQPIEYRYLTSLHWSITQFTPASMEVYPVNSFERAFCITVILFAMITFSSFISSITATMNHLRSLNQHIERNFHVMNRYFVQHDISITLRLRAKRWIRQLLSEKNSIVNDEEVQFLALLPSDMFREVYMEVYMPELEGHPVMNHLQKWHRGTVERVCSSVVKHAVFIQGDRVFNSADHATHMYLILQGSVNYSHATSDWEQIHVNDCICEAALWAQWWTTRGACRNKGHSRCYMLSVDAEKFVKECIKNIKARSFLRVYACLFLMHLNGMEADSVTDLSDGDFDTERARKIASLPSSWKLPVSVEEGEEDFDSEDGEDPVKDNYVK